METGYNTTEQDKIMGEVSCTLLFNITIHQCSVYLRNHSQNTPFKCNVNSEGDIKVALLGIEII